MAIYLLCGMLMLLGAFLGRTDQGLDLAIWAYASAFVLSLMADLLRLLQAKLRAPWQGRKFFELVHLLALAAAYLVYLSCSIAPIRNCACRLPFVVNFLLVPLAKFEIEH